MRTIRASGKEEMSGILDYVHDRRYKIDDIAYDRNSRTLRIPVEIRTRERRSILGFSYHGKGNGLATLIIKNVRDWKVVEDRSHIGYGDINRILASPGTIFIEGSLPVNIEVQVDAHDIELSMPDNVTEA